MHLLLVVIKEETQDIPWMRPEDIQAVVSLYLELLSWIARKDRCPAQDVELLPALW